MMKHKLLYTGALSLLLASCSQESLRPDVPDDVKGIEIRLHAEIDQLNLTRADDSGFADGDHIGVFAVSFTENMQPGELTATGNLADNVCFTFNESSFSWKGDRQLYFPDDKTPVDFYGCYPYDAKLDKVDSYRFAVQRNQASEASSGGLGGYEASDFLWAKKAAVTPSTPMVSLIFQHLLSAVQVTLLEGDSFDEGEWLSLDKDVMIPNTNRNAVIDISTGAVSTSGEMDDKAIVMNPQNNEFRAIVVPQSVDAGKTVMMITVGGHTYELVKNVTMTYVPSKLHKFTIQVDKAVEDGAYEFSLVDESITAWESDLSSHNGKVKEYVVVNVPKRGGLKEAIAEAALDPNEIVNLKITGELNQDDFSYMRENLKYVEALNIKDVIIRDCEMDYMVWEDYCIPNEACRGMRYLKSVVFPEKLIKIGGNAFNQTNLSGSLVLPEGLVEICGSAFANDNEDSSMSLTGTLVLPSTLKRLAGGAFINCDFSGELVLPEGLEYIGDHAFLGCKNLTGELHLPSTLKELGDGVFRDTGLTGKFIIPRHLTEIKGWFFPNMKSFSWPDAPESIEGGAFSSCHELRGDIVIPQSVTHIGGEAFASTKISHIVFPDNLEFLEGDVCSKCHFLMDTIVVPPLIETVGERAFAECDKLDAVVLPKKLEKIKWDAFLNCYSLTYIHCQAIEPPVIEEGAFNGVNKDNFTVEVPEGSVDAYRNAPGWKEFKRISAYKNFIARPSKYNVLNKGGKREIILNADGDWEMTECPAWCHIDKTSGSYKTVLTLTVDPMAHGSAPRSANITFRLNDADQHLTHINIGQYDYEYDEDQYIQIQKATKGNGIDVFFVGDGYDAVDISNGLYLEDMRQEMEYLFGVEPYTAYRDYFNVYTAFAMSEDSGVESLNRWRNTKFHTRIDPGEGRLSTDWMSAMDYCAETCPAIVNRPNPTVGAILVCNSEIYEGICYTMQGSDSFCAVVTKSNAAYPYDARGVIQHEAGGHGFGWLADEYMYHRAYIQKCKCTCCAHVAGLNGDHSWGFGLNLSLTGRFHDVPWSHLIFNERYSDIVDVYEGGYFHSHGVYRSERNSCMNNNVPYFSTWSRQLIVQRIKRMAGEKFDLAEFYSKDSRATGRDFTSTSRSGATPESSYSHKGHAPVFIKNYKFGKKGGKR